jgi:hypothetical protein
MESLVGQIGNLQRIVNPPVAREEPPLLVAACRGGLLTRLRRFPIGAQDTILPHTDLARKGITCRTPH